MESQGRKELPHQEEQSWILNDQGVDFQVVKSLEQVEGAGNITGREDAVQRHINRHVAPVGEREQDRQFFQGEVGGRSPRTQLLQTKIDGIRPMFHRRPETLDLPRRSQQLRADHRLSRFLVPGFQIISPASE